MKNSWKAHLPKPPPTKNLIKGIMVRPRKEICQWLAAEAEKSGCSVNRVVVAILEHAHESEVKR